MVDKFSGFLPPTENYSKLPHQMIEALPLVETVSELKVILYILRHTWGFQDQWKKITLDEFENGRKDRKGNRMDTGVGLSIPSIRDGLKRAEEHGFILVEIDDRDKARVKKFYSLAMAGDESLQPDCKTLTPISKNLSSDVKESYSRSEKETLERNLQKETEKETSVVPEKEEQPDPDTEKPMLARLYWEKGEPKPLVPVDVPDMWDLARRTEDARAQSGGDIATPAHAGGSFALGDRLVAAACARLGRSEPKGEKRKNALAFFEKTLRSEGLSQGDAATLERAVRDWLDPEGDYAFYLPQYDLNPKHGLALRHFGIVLSKAKKAAADAKDRHARAQATNAEALDALDERQAEVVPFPDDDPVGSAIKDELQAQMGKAEFDKYVLHTRFACEDGALVVMAPDGFTRAWLESRLGRTIERALAGIADGPLAVRFIEDQNHPGKRA